MTHQIHLLGSIPLESAAETFTTFGKSFGTTAPRLPDGETDRSWMAWLDHAVKMHPSFEKEAASAYGHSRHMLKGGVDPKSLSFDNLRHADVAKTSYAEFRKQKDAGTVPTSAKFLFPLATPACFCAGILREADQAAVEPAYEKALLAEIAKMAKAIPADELAIQWDAPVETWTIERGTPTRFGKTPDEMREAYVERLVRLGEGVPDDIDLIYHFCYGDPGHKHIFEPSNTRVMVDLANAIDDDIDRPVALYHMPVPRERSDAAYFAPLADLHIDEDAQLCLGLIHVTDGVAGTRARMAAADTFIAAPWRDYMIATECGMGRRDPATIAALLQVHAEVAG